MTGGLALVIASACVFNNFIDRDIDKLMARTSQRALVRGAITGRSALSFGTFLGLAGAGLLIYFTNWLTTVIALGGWVAYVVAYGYWKRRSSYGTVVGSLSGAVPPVVGYCAVTGRLDAAALILFLILVMWQMPHFYAIAIFRLQDYQAAKIPVLPAVLGIDATKITMLAYIVGFILAASLLTWLGYAGYSYLVIIIALGLGWFWLGASGLKTIADIRWAKRMFACSLIVLLGFSLTISLETWLP